MSGTKTFIMKKATGWAMRDLSRPVRVERAVGGVAGEGWVRWSFKGVSAYSNGHRVERATYHGATYHGRTDPTRPWPVGGDCFVYECHYEYHGPPSQEHDEQVMAWFTEEFGVMDCFGEYMLPADLRPRPPENAS